MKQNSTPHNFGHRLRALRRERGWRIVDVSDKTGLAVSTISKVENGRMSLTYDKILQLTQGLGLELTDLFAATPLEKPRPVVTALRSVGQVEEATHISSGWYEYWFLNTDLSSKDMTPILVEAKARTMEEFGEYLRHPGQEFVFVLEGAVAVHTEFYGPTMLGPGQSMYIDSHMGHAYLAASEGRCRFLNICSGSEAGLTTAIAAKPHGTKAEPAPPRAQASAERAAAPVASGRATARMTRKQSGPSVKAAGATNRQQRGR